MIYAGIGSRETPDDILLLMYVVGKRFAEKGYTLRSGGAEGADMVFELGCVDANGKKEIFLPWKEFENNSSELIITNHPSKKETEAIAEQFHKKWKTLSRGARSMHTRNVCQVLGWDLKTPSDFVVCYTPDGKSSGGTGQALRIAKHYKIPIYNLFDPSIQEIITKHE